MTSLRKIAALASAGALAVGLYSMQRQQQPELGQWRRGHHHGGRAAADRRRRREAAARPSGHLVRGEVPEHHGRAAGLRWLASTFTTQLAGGTLPNVFEIPLTDGKTLIENNQLADIDKYVKALPYGGDFNPKLIANGTGSAACRGRARPP